MTKPNGARVITFERPYLYPVQLAAIYDPARFSLIEASTKSGKTTGCLVWSIEAAYGLRRGQSVWWVAPVYSQAKIAYRRAKNFLPRGSFRWNDTEMRIDLAPCFGSIHFRSGEKPDNLFGDDVYATVLDEASRMREEAWHAVRSTLTATRGRCRIIGNMKGRKNWFYRMCRQAEAGAPDMAFHRIDAYQAVAGGVIDAEEVEAAKRELPENIFRQLYLAEAIDDEGNPFGGKFIQAGISALSSRPVVAWGIDLAKSVDHTVIIGLDADGTVAVFSRFQAPWSETLTKIVKTVGSNTDVMIDATGVGDPVTEALQREMNNVRVDGFKFTRQSKQPLIEGLAIAIQGGEIHYPAGHIVSELESYEYEYTRTGVVYTAPAGMHDDCVCALALAWRKLSEIKGRKAKRVQFI